jgi:hypothetical protein
MASVAQVLFHHPVFLHRYQVGGEAHIAACSNNPASCYFCQMAKLSIAISSGGLMCQTV